MGIRKYKPTTPARRDMSVSDFDNITTDKPLKALTKPNPKKAGRNANGRITTRHQGGGHKHHLRIIDFRRNKDGIAAKVERLEYDPNRSAHVALLLYAYCVGLFSSRKIERATYEDVAVRVIAGEASGSNGVSPFCIAPAKDNSRGPAFHK